jgi:UDP-N-acetylmuramyl pentapeptide phosphotransferase/UDP-N-acetylglucosamine-1-phosphate transferase
MARRVQNSRIVQYETCTPLLSFGASLGVIAWLVRSRWARLALDHPTRRSLHAVAVPRIGGIGVLAGVAIALSAVDRQTVWLLAAPLVVLAAVSLVDDIRAVSVRVRFVTHLVAAGTLAAGVMYSGFGAGVTMLVMLGAAWMINLYNFMDGADGMAGGMALFGFFFYGLAAWLAGSESYALLNFGIAAAALGFLCFNFHPARIFMGDSGAVPLGFLAAALGLIGWARQYWPWWFPLLVFSPFIVDASVTLARRALRRERVWEGHREHYYQRLVRMGWGHRNTALAEYVLMFACGLSGVAALFAGPATQGAVLAVSALVYATLALAVDRAWLRFHTRPTA